MLMKILLLFTIALLAVAAEAPKVEQKSTPRLTTEQKLAIREAQLTLTQLLAEKTTLEARYPKLQDELKKAGEALQKATADATPPGFVLQNDLALVPDPAKPERAKPQAP